MHKSTVRILSNQCRNNNLKFAMNENSYNKIVERHGFCDKFCKKGCMKSVVDKCIDEKAEFCKQTCKTKCFYEK